MDRSFVSRITLTESILQRYCFIVMKSKLVLLLCLFASYSAFGKCGKVEAQALIKAIKADDLDSVTCLARQCDFKNVKYVASGCEYGLLHLAAGYAGTNMMQFFLDLQFDVNDQDNYLKLTPLHIATSKMNIEAVAFLIDHGADQTLRTAPITSSDAGLTPLEYLDGGIRLGQIAPKTCQMNNLMDALAGIYPAFPLPVLCIMF